MEIDNIKWPEPWAPISSKEEEQSVGLAKARAEIFNISGGQDIRDSIAEELKREVSQNHPLAGHTCTAIAYNKDDPNEFIFITSNPDMPIAYVHLTWETETDPMYPYTVGYKSLEEFVRKATEVKESIEIQQTESKSLKFYLLVSLGVLIVASLMIIIILKI